ncbi:MAG: hydrogenase small subunit [Anaerolineales bacterium]|jgi:hydrogenase small subunit
MGERETVYESLKRQGLSRRGFFKLSSTLAAFLSMPRTDGTRQLGIGEFKPRPSLVRQVRKALESKPRVPVIWLEFQDCAGCTESISRSLSPTLSNLVLNTLDIEYHETLMAAAGAQAEEAKRAAMEKYAGEYLLVVEGSVSAKDGGIYCTIGGRANDALLREAAAGAAAIVAVGNCATFGGIPAAAPAPTDGVGVDKIITDKPIINLPGCPGIPEVYTNTVVHYLVFGSLPELDELKRPKSFYGVTIHDRCLRRPFYDAGKFADSFDDEGYRKGYCLYKLGCKGPTTYNACASMRWMSGLSFPIQSGHPCLGCSQPDFWDGGGFYQGQSAPLGKPGTAAVGAAAGVGLALGAAAAAANRAQKKQGNTGEEE